MPFLNAGAGASTPSNPDPRFALVAPTDESGRTEAMSDIPDIQHQAYKYGVIGSTAKAAGEIIGEVHKGYQLGKLGAEIENITAPTRQSLTQIASLETDIHGLKQQKRFAQSHEEVSQIEPQLTSKINQLLKAKREGFLNSNDVHLRIRSAVREAINNNPGYTTALSNYASDVLWAAGIREIADPTVELDKAEAAARKEVQTLRIKQAKVAGVYVDPTKLHDEQEGIKIDRLTEDAFAAKAALDDVLSGEKLTKATKLATSSDRFKYHTQMQGAARSTIQDAADIAYSAMEQTTSSVEKAQILKEYYNQVESGASTLMQHYIDSGFSLNEAQTLTNGLRTHAKDIIKLYEEKKSNKLTQEQFDAALHANKVIDAAYEHLGYSQELRKLATKTNSAEKAALLKENPALANQITNFTKLQAHILDPNTRSMLVENLREFDNKTAAAHWLSTFIKSGNFEMVQEVTKAYDDMLKNTASPMVNREDRIKARDDLVNTLVDLPQDANKYLSSETKQNVTTALHKQLESVMYFVNNSKKTYNYSNKYNEYGVTLTVNDENGNVDEQKTETARKVFGVRINEALKVYSKITGASMEEAANVLLPQYTESLGVSLPEVQGGNVKADEFLKKKEGFKEQAYIDGAGKPTIGYGFTTINGKPVKMGDTITREEADAELQKQIGKYQSFKNKVKVPLTEDQETALTSFEYNLGGGVWNTTGKAILHSINAGDFEEAARLMLQYDKARDPKTGKLRVLPGLTSRRQEEGNLLMAQQGE